MSSPRIQVVGGMYILANGGVDLLDWNTGLDSNQNLVDQAITDTATLYITLDPPCRHFHLDSVTIGYVQDPEVNDLSKLWLIEAASDDDQLQRALARWSDEDGIAESTTPTIVPADVDFRLAYPGRLFFITNWTTAVFNAGAAEYFLLRLDGHTWHRTKLP